MGDAAQPLSYKHELGEFKADFLYQDVSQREQAEIFLRNARQYLKKRGYGMLAVKARSVSSTKSASRIFDETCEKVGKDFEIIQRIGLKPYDKFHEIIYCRGR